ncbi:MAG: nodulation protein NfeD [Chloroflexia bacterium]|nr:nodulation protein NfeD [Chloroflexia bacterium]
MSELTIDPFGRTKEAPVLALPAQRPHDTCHAFQAATRSVRPYALLLVAIFAFVSHSASAQTSSAGSGAVYVVPITDTIDLGLAPYLSRVLDEAEAAGAAAVLLQIDTPGGRLDAVLQMRDALLGSGVPTIAFVDRTAFSAGALIAIASEEIYMAPGAVMGAATPVDGVTGETATEKIVSAVRTTFKATAEARGRDPLVAEAMVDPDVSIEGLVTRGQLLTLTAAEATTWGYNDGVAANRAEVLAAAGLGDAPVIETEPSLAERVVRFITDPVVSSLLIIAGVLILIADLFVEGFGIGGMAGLGLLGLFFWGHFLAGLTGWEDLALVVLGLVLIAVEIIIVPGFGVPGLLGLAALLGGLFLAMLGREIQTPEGIEQAGLTILASFIGIVIGLIAIVAFLSRGRRLGRLVLQSTVGGVEVASSPATAGWLGWFGSSANLPRGSQQRMLGEKHAEPTGHLVSAGSTGVALTDLRPSGIATIDGERVDVVTEGEHISEGEPIEVVLDEGYRHVVRRVTT